MINVKKKLIRFFYSCDYVRGFLLNPEDFLISSNIKPLNLLGEKIAEKNRKKRKELIVSTNKIRTKPLLISIILPVLNSDETIQLAIKSIQDQSYKHWELIIVDDGSEDETLKKIYALSDQDTRIKIHKNAVNKGVAYARNIGLKKATGDYITFHDADDISHLERFEYQLSAFLSNSALEVVIFQYARVDKNREPYIINGKLLWNRVSGMMINSKVKKDIGYFKPLYISEDSEYYERILAVYGKKARKIICKNLYYALFSPDSLLFSNANVSIKGRSIDYKINESEFLILESFRKEHQQIKINKLNPYQPFSISSETLSDD